MNEHVERIVRLFVAPSRQERLFALARTRRRWGDFVRELLNDTGNLDPALLEPVSHAHAASLAAVEQRMRALGAQSSAYCIIESNEPDEGVRPLREALQSVVGRELNALVFAVGTGVAYYENHEGETFLLHRRNPKS